MRLTIFRLSKFARVAIVVIAVLVVSIAATGLYYYVTPQPARLRILYTHSDQMVNEVVDAFKKWYERPIEVTMTLTDPQSAYETVTSPFRNPDAELWWGGPLSLFEKAADNLLPYNSTNRHEINATVHLSPLMDTNETDTRWYAASLYALGVMYNEHVLEGLGLAKPQTWVDLLRPEFEENITMVDPTETEFTLPFLMLVIQSRNWTAGWEYLVKQAAFIRDYDDAEATSVLKVASSYLSAAVVPDFYAYDSIQKLEGGGVNSLNFTYLDATILQPDPIAIVKRGNNLNEAKAFVDYVLTQQAQNIIGKYCLPVRQDAAVVPPRINPFDSNFPSIPDYNKTAEEIGEKIVEDYYRVWITERHSQEPSIKTAWKEIEAANRSSPYYVLAWNNFTRAAHYMNYTQIDTIYMATDGWTNNTVSYVNDWRTASTNAYSNAMDSAEKSRE